MTTVTSFTTYQRQWCALINMHRLAVARQLLYPVGGRYFGVPAGASQPSRSGEGEKEKMDRGVGSSGEARVSCAVCMYCSVLCDYICGACRAGVVSGVCMSCVVCACVVCVGVVCGKHKGGMYILVYFSAVLGMCRAVSMYPSHLQSQYNWSQRAVIESAVSCACEPYTMPRMVLLQGPPGTGKTHTIVGLVKSFFEVGRM